MIYIESSSTDPYFNLALEQYIFDEMDKNQEYFMLWQNDHAVIIGKHQNTIAEINQSYVNEHNISVVRRLSGGGAVYHDLGNLNFTFIVNDDDLSQFDFGKFCIPVVHALDKLGVKAEINGRNDITINGKKFSGNSQYAKKNRVMHHGTIMYDSDLSVISDVLCVSKDKIESKGIKSVKSRVTNVKDYMSADVPLEEFKNLLLKYMFEDNNLEEYHLTEDDITKINRIKEERYDKWEWNYGESPQYNIKKERRFEGCGKLEVYLSVDSGVIQDFHVYGDYFGNGNQEDLKKALIGSKINSESIYEALHRNKICIDNYFNRMTTDDFVNLIVL